MRARQVLLVFLNTGGGHRSAALAVAEALQILYGERVYVDLVDVTVEYFPWPLRKLNAIYDRLVRLNGWPWALTYHLTDGARRVAMLRSAWWLATGRSILNLMDDHPADVIVCCHPLLRAPIRKALGIRGGQTQLITLVTDLASGHATWFSPGGGICLVATDQVQEQALAHGLLPDSVRVTGLPVRPCFVEVAKQNPIRVRERLGLDADKPVVLLLSGANGMGPFHALSRAIVNDDVQAQMVMITGRNEELQDKLASRDWRQPFHVKGFVDNVHEWMRAADLLVTKAGPATIAEALAVGVPMIVNGAVPGQEPPNVAYATKTGAALWAPGPIQAARAVRDLLSRDSEKLLDMSNQAQEAGCPDAAWRVARIVYGEASNPRPPHRKESIGMDRLARTDNL